MLTLSLNNFLRTTRKRDGKMHKVAFTFSLNIKKQKNNNKINIK